MLDFEYSLKTNIVFGENRSACAGELCARYGAKKVLVVYGGDYLKKSGLLDRILGSIKENGLRWAEFGDVIPSPTLESVGAGLEVYRREKCDFILSIGGGSAIDTGKAIALGTQTASLEELWNRVFLNYEPLETPVQTGVVLTTAASGSETGDSCVIAYGNRKQIGTSGWCRPAFAILDPVNLLSLPPFQTACGAADIFSHLQERYFVRVPHNDLNDRFLEAAMRLTVQTAELLLVHPDDLDLRAQLMWTSTIGHNGLLDVGRNGGDWACHFIEHEISARLPIVHGEGMAMLTPAWMRFVAKRPDCRDRMMQFASRVWGAEFPQDGDYGIELAIRRQVNWYRLLGLRTDLKNVEGFTDELAVEIADSFGWNPGQFVSLDRDAILEILRSAMK
ncbi:MAG: iron-containing alcohol dehydrogenase [Spirochaetales bacterium]|nr:iron-containing alcohol dehydrogenase [Spirochaetales bacterium]